MPKINILPKSVAELIAAGEVVERPSSVVKELIENSVDAGAKNVTVEIKNGGITYIRVTDDGCGISREDIPAAFISHATSKISSSNDLNAIYTLGFRGEALASAAAVSKIELLTKTPEEETGSSFTIEGGEPGEVEDCGCPDGTTIIIRDLFYNTPARMKFLKKDITESNYVSDAVIKIAISHPEIGFRLIRDSRQSIFTSGNGKLADAIFSLFGKEVSEAMIFCDAEVNGITVSGCVSKPLCGRANRNMQYFFVNGRYVRIPFACTALDNAYKNKIMVGKFPSCFLFINIPAHTIDVNVHPAKTEIRFSSEKPVFETVYYAAVNALSKGDTKRELNFNTRRDEITRKSNGYSGEQLNFPQKAAWGEAERRNSVVTVLNSPPVIKKRPPEAVYADHAVQSDFPKGSAAHLLRDNISIFDVGKTEDDSFTQRINAAIAAKKQKQTVEPVQQKKRNSNEGISENTKEDVENLIIIGEVFKTYIIAQVLNKLYIIDKHAAHERILFNKLKKKCGGSQILLSPVSVRLSMKEYDAVINNLDALLLAGYAVEDFGDGCVLVRECPVELGNNNPSEIITELAGELLRGNVSLLPEKIDWLYHSTACRAAIKAGDVTTPCELLTLAKEVLSSEDVRYCPHGRPVLIELSENELEKQFGRLG